MLGEQPGDLWIARARRVGSERFSLAVDGVDDPRMPRHEPLGPVRVPAPNGEEHILDLDREQRSALPKIMDCPSRRRGAVRRVAGVDLGARIKQQLGDGATAEERGAMERRRATASSSPRSIACRSRVRSSM